MQHRARMIGAALAALLFVGACVTVNVYFPAAEVEKTAEEIVSDVYSQDEKQPGTEAKPENSSSLMRSLLALVTVAEAHAQTATSVSNATIRGLKQQIASNHSQLLPFYQGGNLGITNTGLLDIRSTDGLSVSQIGTLRRLVSADNQARSQLYREVAAALKVDASQVGRIQGIFAQEWQGQAGKGWWIQQGSAWKRK
jgi:uncharacterized protein YdbL (DUF1318 family)